MGAVGAVGAVGVVGAVKAVKAVGGGEGGGVWVGPLRGSGRVVGGGVASAVGGLGTHRKPSILLNTSKGGQGGGVGGGVAWGGRWGRCGRWGR